MITVNFVQMIYFSEATVQGIWQILMFYGLLIAVDDDVVDDDDDDAEDDISIVT